MSTHMYLALHLTAQSNRMTRFSALFPRIPWVECTEMKETSEISRKNALCDRANTRSLARLTFLLFFYNCYDYYYNTNWRDAR